MNKNVGFSLVLIILACLTIALILHNSPHHENLLKQQLDHQPNAFIHKVDYYQYNDKGDLHSHLVSPYIIHFSRNNSFYFILPHCLIYTSQHEPWAISADRGKSQNEIEWIYLWGHVKIHEPPHTKELETTITTKNMIIFPSRSFAQTDQPVTIVRPDSIIKATGMTTDLKHGIIRLISHTLGIYEADTSVKNHKQRDR